MRYSASMNRSVLVLAFLLAACSGDDEKNDDECIRYAIIYEGDETAPLVIEQTYASGSSGSSYPSVALARGLNERSWSCTSPASAGLTTVEAWVDADHSCDLADSSAPPCKPTSGDPFISFEQEIGHGFHVLTLDFSSAELYP